MPKDRRLDRHALPARIIRPKPEELWTALGEKVGERRRSEVISLLIAGYLDGRFVVELDEGPPAEADGTSKR